MLDIYIYIYTLCVGIVGYFSFVNLFFAIIPFTHAYAGTRGFLSSRYVREIYRYYYIFSLFQ